MPDDEENIRARLKKHSENRNTIFGYPPMRAIRDSPETSAVQNAVDKLIHRHAISQI
jgi:hypothetical protein